MWSSWLLLIFFGLLAIYAIRADVRLVNCPPAGSKNSGCHSGNGEINYLGRANKDDPIDLLLTRIDWVAESEQRVSWELRAFAISYISLLLLIVAVFRRTPRPDEILLTLLVVFIVVISFINYSNFHSVLYSSYYIHDNVDRIRSRLDLSPTNLQEADSLKLPHPSQISARKFV